MASLIPRAWRWPQTAGDPGHGKPEPGTEQGPQRWVCSDPMKFQDLLQPYFLETQDLKLLLASFSRNHFTTVTEASHLGAGRTDLIQP